jgi:hypothetical protein
MRASVVALLLLGGPTLAAAQLCVGNTAFELSGLQSGANIDKDKLAQLYALEFRVSYRVLVAAADFGLKTWEVTSLNGTSRSLGLTLGLHSSRRHHAKFGVCPLIHFRQTWGPNEISGSTFSYSETSLAAELSAGYLLARSRLWDIVPTAAIRAETGNPALRSSLEGGINQYQDFCCGRRSYTTLRVGVGLGFSDEVTLLPEIGLPVGGAGQRTYAIRATLRLGKGI